MQLSLLLSSLTILASPRIELPVHDGFSQITDAWEPWVTGVPGDPAADSLYTTGDSDHFFCGIIKAEIATTNGDYMGLAFLDFKVCNRDWTTQVSAITKDRAYMSGHYTSNFFGG